MKLKEKINTIYIISKGRPQCATARCLTRMDYPGDWFIVCGNNDKTIPQYIERWGKEKVLIFDWFEEVKTTDFRDNLGVEKYSSGASPVRNATMRISRDKGELRHWQFEDDYPGFVRFNNKTKSNLRIASGDILEKELYKIASYGYSASLGNVGFQPASTAFPEQSFLYSKRVFNAHNLPSTDDLFVRWCGRMNDDTINAIDVIKKGQFEISFQYLSMNTYQTQTETGGNTDLYQDNGTVLKTAYAICASPLSVKLTVKFGRYHHQNSWEKISPKLINEKYDKL